MSTATKKAPSVGRAPATQASLHLEMIRTAVGSDRGISELLGVSPAQVSRWRRGQAPDPANADRLGTLALVVEMLTRSLHPAVIEDWLMGANAHLDGRTPGYLLRHGQFAEVIAAVEALKAGVFA